MINSGKTEVLIPRCLCEIENVDNLNVDDEGFASVFVAWEKGIVSELKPINIKNKKPKKSFFQDLLRLTHILINLSLLESFLILNQTIMRPYQ